MKTTLQTFATGVLLLLLAFLTGAGTAQAQSNYEPYSFDTLAGSALSSGSTDNTGGLARFDQPWGLAVDAAGNVYVADTQNHSIRKITPGGAVTLLAGVPGSTGSANGASNIATFDRPTGVAVNSAGSVVYVADSNNHLIRQISGGFVTTLAGTDGVSGIDDGAGVSAQFRNPFGVALDPAGALLYVSDQNNQTIREIALPGGAVSTLAGSPGVNGYQDGAGNVALFNTPRGIAVDGSGNLYVADAGNLTVRKIDLNSSGGAVSTLAGQLSTPGFTDGPGGAALFSALSGMSPFGGPCGVAVDGAGNVYVTDQGNHIIRKISPAGNVTTLAGVPLTSGGDNGPGNVARFNSPGGVAVDSAGELYVADTANHTIRTGTDMMLTFGGFNHGSVGNATLTTDSDALVVSGTGLDGPDGPGVDILPGWLSGFVLGIFYEIQREDGTLVFTDFVDLNDGTRQTAGTVTIDRVGPNRDHSFDFSSIGASTYTLQIFNCAELVYESAGNSGDGFTTEADPMAGAPSSAGWHVGDGSLGFSMTSPSPIAHHVRGPLEKQTVMGDRAVVTPENPTANVASGSGARIQFGRGVSELRILEESLRNGKTTFSAIGNAGFETGGGQLTLANPDLDEEIGVSIAFGDGCGPVSEPGSGSVDWMQLPTDLPHGAFLQTTWRGTVDGLSDTAIASMGALQVLGTPGIALSTDFTALSPTSFRLEFYLNGNLVGEEADQPIDQPLRGDTFPTGNRLDGAIAIYTWDDDVPCIFDRWGNMVVADEVRIIPENTNGALITGRLSGTLVVSEISLLTFRPRNGTEPCVPGETWTPRASSRDWRGITSSSDGSKLAAVVYNGQIHTSDNFGVTWTLRETNRKWWDIAMSWDGTKLAAVANPGQLYISADSGVTWTARASTQNWQSVAMSWDGSNLVAVAFNDKIYTSTNSGVTWMARESDRTWRSVTMSWDGSKLAAVASPGNIYTSDNSGVTWTPRDSTRGWWGIASSSNGAKLVAVEHLGRVYTSDNSGVTWTPRETSRSWLDVASSWDGSKLAATAFGGRIYLSPDSGVTWMPQESSRHWDSIVMSSAGDKLAATTQGGTIHTSGCNVPPSVICAGNKMVNCSDPWSFDPPTIAPECSAAIVTVLDTVSDGSCPETITRTWLVTNACGGDYACSQTVTVVNDTAPLFITVSSSKTVSCTDDWGFDQPIASDAYSGELITPVIVGSVSSGSCPEVITRTWVATDACGNSNTYSQAVTVTTPQPQFTFLPQDKTVECGADWSFDTPAAVIYCDEPPTFRVISSVSSGSSCTEVITRTWRITDHCGNFTECSQTVTVIDTTGPFIECPTKTIVVALDKDCRLEIPTIQPVAGDDCTPRGQLIYTQNPPAGTSFPDPCQRVTVTVTDACNNVSTCEVMVCGIDKTPPTLICPKSVTVTDCIVPDVLALVSASDDCTAEGRLLFTQSPLPGTPIAAGGSQVSVTVTDSEGNTATCIIQLIPIGSDSFLDVLFNTGVNSNKAFLPYGSVDPHYTLGPVPAGTPTGPGFYNAPDSLVGPAWMTLPPFTLSRWISLYGNNSQSQYPPGFYTFTNQFVLPSGMDPLAASISGRWSAASGGKMYFNGSLMPASSIPTAPWGSFWPYWTSFIINSGFLSFPAVNTITFVVETPTDWGGRLRVEFTDAFANCNTCTPPVVLQNPRPQSLPLNSTAVFNANVSGTPPFSIQWYHNNVPLSNGGHYSGVNTPTLTVTPLGYAEAGMYHAVISNPCGAISSLPAKLTIHKGWPWWWSRWDFDLIGKPLTATVGSDLILEGAGDFGLSSGTTTDFGLPNSGGKPVNVMVVPGLPAGTFLRLPFPEAPEDEPVDGYTLIADIYSSDSTGPSTIFTIFDRWGNLKFEIVDQAAGPGGPGGRSLNLSGDIDGAPFDLPCSTLLEPDAWNRVAVVVDGTACGDGGLDPDQACGEVSFHLYVNGKLAGTINVTPVNDPPSITSESVATVLSSQDGTEGGLFVSSLEFHHKAFTSERMAGIGGPKSGPISVTDTSARLTPGQQKLPALSASLSDGMLELVWDDTDIVHLLEESSDLTAGLWTPCLLPFRQTEMMNGRIRTTAYVDPTTQGRTKFYRLRGNTITYTGLE